MTDRYKGLVVTLENDMRDDDAEVLIAAIRQLRGVIGVAPVKVDHNDHINRERIKYELRAKLLRVLDEDRKD